MNTITVYVTEDWRSAYLDSEVAHLDGYSIGKMLECRVEVADKTKMPDKLYMLRCMGKTLGVWSDIIKACGEAFNHSGRSLPRCTFCDIPKQATVPLRVQCLPLQRCASSIYVLVVRTGNANHASSTATG